MNTYVLFCQTLKVEKIAKILNQKNGIKAIIPRMETYIRKTDEIVLKVMFPGYLFVQSNLEQEEFSILLKSLYEEKDGIIKELKKENVSALTHDEIELLNKLLNKNGILKMSYGYKMSGRTIVIKGPLEKFQDNIIDSDKRDMHVTLNINFMGRYIKAGLMFMQNK